ncbi:hypothetical protein VTO42DRAFT_3510 [Malbranchea cinnamomea]
MFDSELESQSGEDLPADETLERGLRDTVAKLFRTGNTDELTVKRVRLATEKALNLEMGFFKGHEIWKTRSDQIIRDEVEIQERQEEQKEQQPSDTTEEKRPETLNAKPTKRATTSASQNSRKKRKKEPTPEPLDETSSLSSDGDEKDEVSGSSRRKTSKSTWTSKTGKDNDADVSDTSDKTKDAAAQKPQKAKHEQETVDSDSEMSDLIDEEPVPKKQTQKSSQTTQAKKQKASGRKRKDESPTDPDQTEIKRLQGWLVKCGIRKMWSRELAPYDTPKAKIKHLKQMLKDAGMEGRYSIEKANRIREERELRADLEVVQEGAKKWGRDAESSDEGGRPRRRQVRAFKNLDFLEGEGEESD